MTIPAASFGAALVLAAAAVFGQSPQRGELLYSTYCIGCHTTQVHWREQRLATDWASLRFQVRRWLENTGVAHDNDDVGAIATYLNALYYRYPPVNAKQRTDMRTGRDARAYVEGPAGTIVGAR